MKPSIVLVITDTETNAQLTPSGGRFTEKLGVGFLELRVDLFKKRGAAYARRQFENRRKLKIPLILTIRNRKKEGARREFSDDQKWALLQDLMPLTDWVDIELSWKYCAKAVALARQLKKKVLISKHDFARIPPHLEQTFKKALSTRADMVKIAAKATSPGEFFRFMDFTRRHRGQPLVTMCVGRWGPVSRLVFPSAGSRWVYTFLTKAAVPGQLPLKDLLEHFS